MCYKKDRDSEWLYRGVPDLYHRNKNWECYQCGCIIAKITPRCPQCNRKMYVETRDDKMIPCEEFTKLYPKYS